MGFWDKKRERAAFQERFQTDDTKSARRAGSLERKRGAIVRTYESPVLPRLARLLTGMLPVLTAACVAVDVKNALRFGEQLGRERALAGISLTGLAVWGALTVLLALVCAIGMRQNGAAVRKKAREGGADLADPEESARCARAARRLNRPYRVSLLIALAGTAAWAVFWGIVS